MSVFGNHVLLSQGLFCSLCFSESRMVENVCAKETAIRLILVDTLESTIYVSISGSGFMVYGQGFRVWGLGFRVWGLGFRI